MAQRSSTGSHVKKASSSESDPSHNRPVSNRSVKIGDRRPVKISPSQDALNQRKLGTRIADLESQLGQAQQELKLLKSQLSTSEAAKRDAQQQLRKSKKTTIPKPDVPEKPSKKTVDSSISSEVSEDTQHDSEAVASPKGNEMAILRTKLDDKERELRDCYEQNENLQNLLSQAGVLPDSGTQAMFAKIRELEEEREASKDAEAKLAENLEAAMEANKALEEEIKLMRVHTEQWRKAADAAAAVLADDADANAGRVGSTVETPVNRFLSFEDFQEAGDGGDDGLRKSKGSGMKISDLWKKKNTK